MGLSCLGRSVSRARQLLFDVLSLRYLLYISLVRIVAFSDSHEQLEYGG